MAKVSINGVTSEVPEGTSIIAAADRAGVFIPRFCYHPDLAPAGNCRICQVEIEGSPRLAVSCMTPVKDGMVVRSDSDKVKKAVRGDLEFLLANHPVDCPICDQAGECYLQDYYMAVGQHPSRVPLGEKVRKRKLVDLGPMVVLDSERCVMCSRCIRFSDDVTKTHQMGFFNRGSHMEIGTFRDRPIEDAYSGCYPDVCPVGALTSKDFRFQSRVWFLNRTDSVCPECSTGCNIRIDHKEGEVYRFLPRRNPEVNQSWMCDRGRMSYRTINAPDRLRVVLGKKAGGLEPSPWGEALERIVAALDEARRLGAGTVAGIASPRATCEELWLFRRLVREVAGSPHLDFRVTSSWQQVGEREDEILRRRDHQPNTRGALALDVLPGSGGSDVAGILARAGRGEIRVLYLLGPEVLESWPDRQAVRQAMRGAGLTILHDTHLRAEQADAGWVLPVATWAETAGTWVNYADRVQRLAPAFAAPGDARPAVEVLGAILGRLGSGSGPRPAREVFRELAAAQEAFAGLNHERVGPLGRTLVGSAAQTEAAGMRTAS